jgi:hypothetical protein
MAEEVGEEALELAEAARPAERGQGAVERGCFVSGDPARELGVRVFQLCLELAQERVALRLTRRHSVCPLQAGEAGPRQLGFAEQVRMPDRAKAPLAYVLQQRLRRSPRHR